MTLDICSEFGGGFFDLFLYPTSCKSQAHNSFSRKDNFFQYYFKCLIIKHFPCLKRLTAPRKLTHFPTFCAKFSPKSDETAKIISWKILIYRNFCCSNMQVGINYCCKGIFALELGIASSPLSLTLESAYFLFSHFLTYSHFVSQLQQFFPFL